jgi:hypothetical protein
VLPRAGTFCPRAWRHSGSLPTPEWVSEKRRAWRAGPPPAFASLARNRSSSRFTWAGPSSWIPRRSRAPAPAHVVERSAPALPVAAEAVEEDDGQAAPSAVGARTAKERIRTGERRASLGFRRGRGPRPDPRADPLFLLGLRQAGLVLACKAPMARHASAAVRGSALALGSRVAPTASAFGGRGGPTPRKESAKAGLFQGQRSSAPSESARREEIRARGCNPGRWRAAQSPAPRS